MLAPLRDYLYPHDPKFSSLLSSTKTNYFTRLSRIVGPTQPGFKETQWIKSEDVNVEHLLDAPASIDTNSGDIWKACVHFLQHLVWFKARETVLRSKIEDLPDYHPSKIRGLFELSRLFNLLGNHTGRKRILTRTLTLARGRGDDFQVALTLSHLSDANRWLGLFKEGIQWEIHKRRGDISGQADCSSSLARLLTADNQLDAAEDVASRTVDLALEGGDRYVLCLSHRTLSRIYISKKKKEKAVHHLKAALEIASSFDWKDELFWIHHALARLFLAEGEFNDAQVHIERAKQCAAETAYTLGRAMETQARIWRRQHRLEDAKSEASSALGIFEKLGLTKDVKCFRDLLRKIVKATKG